MTYTDDELKAILEKLGSMAAVRDTLIKIADVIPGFANTIKSATGWLDTGVTDFTKAGGSFSYVGSDLRVAFTLPDSSTLTFIVGSNILTETDPSKYQLAVDYVPSATSLAHAFDNTPFDGLAPSKSEIVISNQAVTVVDGVHVDAGISLISEFNIAESVNPFLSFVHKQFKIDTVGVIANAGPAQQSFSGVIDQGFSAGGKGSFGIQFNEISFSMSEPETPGASPVFTESATLTFKNFDPSQTGEPDLVVSTGFKLGTTSASLFGEVDASASGTWKNPFGFTGAALTTMAVEVGVSNAKPHFGVFADMSWYGDSYTLAFNVDIDDPLNDAFELTVKNPVNLAKLYAQLNSNLLGPSGSTLIKLATPLFQYIPITAMSATDTDGSLIPMLKYAPVGATIGNETIDPGLAMSANVDIAGQTGKFSLVATSDGAGVVTELKGDLQIEQLKLGNYLSISGANGGNLTAHFDASAITGDVDFSGSGQVALFGFTLGKADFDFSEKIDANGLPTVNAHVEDSFLDLGLAKFTIDHLDLDLGASAIHASGAADISVLGNKLTAVSFDMNGEQLDFKLSGAGMSLGGFVSLTGSFHLNEQTGALNAEAGVKIVGINQSITSGKLVATADGSVTVTGNMGLTVQGVGITTKLTLSYDSATSVASLKVDADALGLSHIGFTLAVDGGNLESQITSKLSDAMLGGIGEQAAWVADAIDKGLTSTFSAGNFKYAADQVDNFVKNAGAAFVNDITNLFGSKREHNQTILGNDSGQGLEGNGGNDILFGYGGNDVLIGHQGNDMLDGGTGDDTMYGGSGKDILNGGDGNDRIIGDELDNNDWGDDKLYGGAGDDYLYGDDDRDTNKGTGNDELHGGQGDDRLWGGGGNDVLYGDDGNDNLDGGTGNNTLYGGAGNDTLANSAGGGHFYGGAGNDTYTVGAGEDVHENSNEGIDTVKTNTNYTLGANVENLILVQQGETGLGGMGTNGTGNELDNNLRGNSLNNTLDGGAGNDYIDGGSGADRMIGGDGNDTFVVDNGSDVVVEKADYVTAAYTTPAYVIRDPDTGQVIARYPAVNHPAVTHIGGIDTVVSSIGYTLGENLENLTLAGTANVGGAGNAADNILTGNAGNNLLSGAGGNDTLDGKGGADSMYGGNGNDTYVVDNAADYVQEDGQATDIDTVQSSISWTLGDNLENLTLTGTANINATGNSLNNTLTGNDGANMLDGMAGADTMIGGLGNDTFVLDSSSDVIVEKAGEGIDTVMTSIDGYVLGDNLENLTLTAGAIKGTGNALDNVLTGNSKDNILIGDAGNDTLDGGTGADLLIGGKGNDTYVVDKVGDVIVESAGVSDGIDTVISSIDYTLGANLENLTLTGSAINGTGNAHNNTLIGNASNNTLSGGVGDDLLDGGAGADQLIGGIGDDSYVIDNAGDVVTEKANEGIDKVQSSVSYVLSDNVENLTLSGADKINATGNALDNVLTGNMRSNTLVGGAGNDTLDGGMGRDVMEGGTGNDTYIVDVAGDTVTETSTDLAEIDTVISAVSYDLSTPDHANLENVTLTGTVGHAASGASQTGLSATGNDRDNVLIGNVDDNTLTGGAGNDTLDGGKGKDTLIGGTGNDTYVVNNPADVVTEKAGEGNDTVMSSITYALGNNLENLTLIDSDAINGTGNALDNVLIGNSAANTLTGSIGSDTLDGGAGADTLIGGTGNDTYVVDDAKDVVTENSGEGTDTVKSAISYTLGANVENLTLTGTANLAGTGNALNNVLIGNNNNNVLTGGDGNDVLYGLGGDDTLTGGTGADVFKFDAGISGVDTVTDFGQGDTLKFVGMSFGTAAIVATMPSGASGLGKIHVISANGTTTLEIGTGIDSNPVATVKLVGTYTAADFEVSGDSISLRSVTPNQAPSGADATLSLREDTAYVFQTSDFGFSDAAQDQPDALRAVLMASLPTAGSLTLDGVAVSAGQSVDATDIASGKLVYTPGADASGSNYAQLRFQVQDTGGTAQGGVDTDATSNTLRFDVLAVNDAPQGQDHTLSVLQRGSVALALALADFGFSDTHDTPANGLIAVQIVSLPEAGALTLGNVPVGAGQFVAAADIAAGGLTFTPAAGGSGAGYAHFSFIVYDDGGGDNGGSNADPTPHTLTVDLPANTAPVDQGENVLPWSQEDRLYLIDKAALLADFTDAEGDALTLKDVAVSIGTLADNGDGTLSFTPPADFNGELDLSFNVDDGYGGVTPASRTIYLVAVNDAPQGQDHTLSLLQRGSVTLALADFGFSDTHDTPANGLIAVQIVSVPEAGVLTLGDVTVGAGQFVAAADIAAGGLKFTPAASGSGTGYAHFSFIVYDDGGGDNGGTNADPTPRVMTFDVQAVNTAPVDRGADILPWGTEDTPMTLSKADLLADFVDADGDALTLTDLRVTLGTLVDNGNGTLSFTPPADFNGELHLIFNVDDGHSGVTASSRIIYLTATNDAAVIGSADVKVDETNAPIAVGGTLSITDVDSPASFQAQPGTAGKYGVFALGGDGAWTYKANLAYDYLNPGDTLKDVFQVYAADGTAASVTVTINGTADTTTVHLGDAPVRQSGTGGQWAQAWTQTGYSLQHKADITNSGEAWSAVTLNSVSAQQLGGGDVSAGNLGVSGQSAATSTVKQEIDGKEALRIVTPSSADSVTIKLAGLYAHDDGSAMNESGLLRLLDAGGHVVAEQLFVADSADGSKTITLTAPGGFKSMELVAGAYDATGHFVYGAYSNDQGAYGAPVSSDAAGNKHGSDFLLHSVDFTVALVGTAGTPS